MKDVPALSFDTIKRMEDMSWFTHARIFDDRRVVAQRETACYIWKTSAGLVIFDGIWPHQAVYEAILRGTPKDAKGSVDAPIGRHPIDRKKMAVTQNHSRRAVTHYRVLESLSGYSYVQCKLETGRTHQIRVHMAYLGHPVAGDTVYGSGKNELGLTSQCLHARYIQFIHPSTGEKMHFGSELPAEFRQALDRLGHDPAAAFPEAGSGW